MYKQIVKIYIKLEKGKQISYSLFMPCHFNRKIDALIL